MNKTLTQNSKFKTSKRYTLSELLKGTTPKNMRQLLKATQWAREGKPIGRELA